MHLDRINSKSPLQLLYIYLAINRTLFVILRSVKIILILLNHVWWYRFCLNDKIFFFFPIEDVAAEKWTEKDKGHGIQPVNNPHGYSKNCPHVDILTEKALVPISYSTSADQEKPVRCQFSCTEYVKLQRTEENEALDVYWPWACLPDLC